jgi:hypothetical protein
VHPASGCAAGTHTVVPNTEDIKARGAAALNPSAPHSQKVPLDSVLTKIVAMNPHWITEGVCVDTGKRHGPAPANSRSGQLPATQTSGPISHNWSGYEYKSVDVNHRYYKTASMNYTQLPAVYPPASSPMDDSVWAGIGSGNSVYDSLVQAGTDALSGPAYGGIGAYSGQVAFYELYPQENEQVVSNLTVNAGAQILTDVEYDLVNNQAIFTLCADSNCVTLAQDFARGEGSWASQIEWIVERASSNGIFDMLQPFNPSGTTTITNAGGQEVQGNGTTVDGFYAGSGFVPTSYLVDYPMTSCDGSTSLATPGGIDTHGDFTDYWHNSGKNESC